MKRKDLLTKLLLLCVMIVGSVNAAWADTVIKTIDFSQSEWSSVTFLQGNSTTPDVHNGVTFYSSNSTKQFSLSGGVLTFPNNNISSGNYALGFPVTDIVGGVITIKVYNGSSSLYVKYTVKSGGTAYSTSDCGGGTSASSGAPCTIDVTGISDTKAYVYIGRGSSSYKNITKIEVMTPELKGLLDSSFHSLYKESDSESNSSLMANLPSFFSIRDPFSSPDSSTGNTSEIETPHDFSTLSSNKYYRLKASTSTKIVIGGLSRVKSIRFYGNGTGKDGTINISVRKLSGQGTEMTVKSIDFEDSQKTVKEYSTGDLSVLTGYDVDTYYLYTITFTKKSDSYSTYFSLWGIYIECVPSSFTVTYNENGGEGSIANSTGASIMLSDGTGFTAPSGYTLAGWNTDAHGVGTSYTLGQTNVKANLTLYAVWTQSGTIDDNGGTADGAYTATYNKAGISITTAPVNSSYAIKGYYEAGTGDDLVATSAGALQASTSFTDASGYWTYTGSAPTLYAQWENTHELTVSVNDADMGSAEAEETTLTEGEETEVTAVAETGYKFRSWSVSGTGAELSSETANPVTFTMGSADATVTATFSALEHYTITYNKGANGSGTIADGEKTEDADFTLSSSTYTYASHLQTGWATSDGGDKAYELGGTYTGNADLTLYPYWIEQYTLTYDANGGSGTMSDTQGNGDITLTANAYTKTGYTFLGWATSQDNADAHTVAYTDKAAYTLSANATLYAVWGENYCELKPATSGSAPSASDAITMQSGAFGGTMSALSTNLSYTGNGLLFASNSSTKVNVVLNDYLKEGSVISITLKNPSGGVRGLYLYSSDGSSKVDELKFASTAQTYDVATFQYKVTAKDKLVGTNGFQLWRLNNIYLQSLTVTDCQPGGVITASGWNTYSSNKKLDLSTLTADNSITAYYAKAIADGYVSMTPTDAIIDADEGIMIKGTAGDKFTIDATADDATFSGDNLLEGLPNGGTVSANDGNYVFGWADAADPGFYFVNDTEPTLGAGKAYLSTGSSSQAARLTMIFDDDEVTTGIADAVQSSKFKDQSYYDLQGRKVAQPTKGLYIVNGKKVVVK